MRRCLLLDRNLESFAPLGGGVVMSQYCKMVMDSVLIWFMSTGPDHGLRRLREDDMIDGCEIVQLGFV